MVLWVGLGCGGGGSSDDDTDAAGDFVLDRYPDAAGDVHDGLRHEDFVSPNCPVYAGPVALGTPVDGSRECPVVGLQEALDARGTCDHLILLPGPAGEAFDLSAEAIPDSWSEETLTIEGDPESAERPVLDGEGARRGLRVGGHGLVLRHLSLRGGVTVDFDPRGGCLMSGAAELLVEDVEFSRCSARVGAALWAQAGNLVLRDSTFHDNRALGSGGAVALSGTGRLGSARIEGCDFERNVANYRGGALQIDLAPPDSLITGCRFLDNRADQGGAAISGYPAGDIVGNRFERNEGGGFGGAIAADGALLHVIEQNVFIENMVHNGGEALPGCCNAAAAIDLDRAFVIVRNNVFYANVANADPDTGEGGTGAVRLRNGRSTVHNNVFADNFGGPGTAHLSGARMDVRGNIFLAGMGQAVTAEPSEAGPTVIEYNDAFPPGGSEPYAGEATIGAGNLQVDPVFIDGAPRGFRLGLGSPCIDAGDPAASYFDDDGSRNDLGAFGGPRGSW
jgi:predicted outer membrane repeat protein